MEITVSWIFGIIVSVVTAVISFSLKEIYGSSKKDKTEALKRLEELKDDTENKLQSLEQALNEAKKELEIFKEKMPEKYTLKDDFHREINKLDAKMDNLKEEVSGLNKNVTALIAKIEVGFKKWREV